MICLKCHMREWYWYMEMKMNLKFLKCSSYNISDYWNVFSSRFAVPSGMASSIWTYTLVPKSQRFQPTRDKAICKLTVAFFCVLLLLNICCHTISWIRDPMLFFKNIDFCLHFCVFLNIFATTPPKKYSISNSVPITSFAGSILCSVHTYS